MTGGYHSRQFPDLGGKEFTNNDLDIYTFRMSGENCIMTVRTLDGENEIGVKDVIGISLTDYKKLKDAVTVGIASYPSEWSTKKKVRKLMDEYVAQNPLMPAKDLHILAITTDDYMESSGKIFHLSKAIDSVDIIE